MTVPSRTLDLSGGWRFATDPDGVGIAERWFAAGHVLPDEIVVPGAWNTQGVEFDRPEQLAAWESSRSAADQPLRDRGLLGPHTEAERLHHVFPGPAWYATSVAIPVDWEAECTELILEGVQRTATVWVDGTLAATIVGAVVSTAVNLTDRVRPGETLELVVRVDARRDPEVDPWWGCRDTLDFLFLTWGGLWAPVRLRGRSAVQVTSVGVRVDVGDQRLQLTLDVSDERADVTGLSAEVIVTDPHSGRSLATGAASVRDGRATLALTVPGLRPWSPADPHRYPTMITIVGDEGPVARRTERLGGCELTVAGTDLRLNGLPYFARGYGDDCIFPLTIAPPYDLATYRERLMLAKSLGFDWVRLHSWVPPEALLDAADEVGVFVQPELPIGLTWEPPSPSTYDLVRTRWRELITTFRHHPSVAVWCLGNELYDSHPLAAELYAVAKDLDPGRLVIESDGTHPADTERVTLDLAVVQFAEGRSVGVDDDKYALPPTCTKPVIAHEVGYFATLGDLDQIGRFGRGLRPYWLSETAALVAQGRGRDRYNRDRKISLCLQQVCLKINTESLRASGLSGMSHWLLYDYPACAEGLLDTFGGSKGIDPAWLRTFNAPVVVLTPGLTSNLRSGDLLTVTPFVSCFEQVLPVDVDLRATVLHDGRTVGTVGQRVTVAGPRQRCGPVALQLPDVVDVTRFQLELEVAGGLFRAENSWDLWVHPDGPRCRAAEELVVNDVAVTAMIDGGDEAEPVLVATRRVVDVDDHLRSGGRVLLLDPANLLPTTPIAFRSAAWDGAGHFGIALPREHPALAPLRTGGGADLQLYRLVEGAASFAVDPAGAAAAVIVRVLDRPDRLAERGLLAEFRIGRGRLLVSGFNLHAALSHRDPAAELLLASMIDYASSAAFDPRASLPPS